MLSLRRPEALVKSATMHTPARTELRLPDWLVQNRNFVLLWAGYGVAAIGDHLSEMALLKQRNALEGDHATRVQALIQFGFFFPFVLLGPLAGWWSDRSSRKLTMIVADLLRAVLVFGLGVLVAGLAAALEPYGAGDFSIVIPLGVIGALAAFFSPARQALLPTLIRDDQLIRANAMISALGTIGAILSAVLGGYLVAHAGAEWNYRINAVTFVLSAAFVSLIDMSHTRAVPHPPLTGVWAPVVEGFRYVRQHRRVLQMIVVGSLFWAAAGVVISVVPAIVREVFAGRIQDVALYRGIIGVGLASGAAVMTLLGPSMPLKMAMLIALAGSALWVLALDVAYLLRAGRVLTGLCLFGIGGAGASLLVCVMSTIQHFVPDSRRGRVCGVSDMCTMGAMVAASGALGIPHIPHIDAYIPYLLAATGLALLIASSAAWRIYRTGDVQPATTRVVWAIVRFYARFWCRMSRIGPCTLPRNGSVILAANHTAGIDPIVLIAASPARLPGFIVEEDYYRKPVAGWFMRLAGCIPIDRDHPDKSFLSNSLRMLKDGGCLGIFPEGTFAVPGQPPPSIKSGVGLLALRTGSTVIPCHIGGTRYFDNPFAAYFVRHRVRVRFGKPVDLSAFRGRERDRSAHQEASELIMQRVMELAS
jgi:1-acyl-sn-glycerol-3-phosphate acyltransferase